jgi:uncharacterized damage-inducible protein DinB
MANLYTWVERKYEFDLPKQIYPAIVERVRGTPARAEELVRGLPITVLTRRETGKNWSIQENIGHLLNLESLWTDRLDQFVAGLPELKAWEVTNRSSWDADYNSSSIETILADFRQTRFELVSRLDDLDDSLIMRTALHPRLQTPMRTIDLAFFIAEHDDFHFAKITELKRAVR